MTSFADRVIKFNSELDFSGALPPGIQVMNPFKDDRQILTITKNFYKKFYNDNNIRKLILGINPGRFGAGTTGIPFTDTKRLKDKCNINIDSASTHEPSSVFIYEFIEKYGGVEKFYNNFYINAICPLGFIKKNNRGNWINCNYYDYEELFTCMAPFIISSLKTQINFGVDTRTCFVLGKKNAQFLKRINGKEHLFDSLVVLEHPRYIVQYKWKHKEKYITDYLGSIT